MRRVEFSLNQNPKLHIVVHSSLNKQIIDGTFLLLVRRAHGRRQFRARFRPRNKVITSPHSGKHKINILCDNHHRAHNRKDFSQKPADSRQFENAEYICQPLTGEKRRRQQPIGRIPGIQKNYILLCKNPAAKSRSRVSNESRHPISCPDLRRIVFSTATHITVCWHIFWYRKSL